MDTVQSCVVLLHDVVAASSLALVHGRKSRPIDEVITEDQLHGARRGAELSRLPSGSALTRLSIGY